MSSKQLLHFVVCHRVNSVNVTTKCAAGGRFGLGIQVSKNLNELVVLNDFVRSVATSNPLNELKPEFTLYKLPGDLLVYGELCEILPAMI